MKDYIGNPLQIKGVEQYVLQNTWIEFYQLSLGRKHF